jgi:2-keto-4-pentenoate hydratase/2-oxohepta-3-ene-1,7-dioic acid hydratase in catechol pathway
MPFGIYRRLEAFIPIEEIRMLSPVKPGKILGIGRNYPENAKEQKVEIPEVPMVFLKPPSAIIGPDEAIHLPPQSQQVEFEAELGVVISRQGRWIGMENVRDYILGYTIINDVTARDLQQRDGQWTRSKGFDTFCPVGPWIETDMDVSDLLITCRINDEIKQLSSTREMVFNISQIIIYISSIMTLEPGDLILTGTPAGVGVLKSGDKVEIEIEGIGILRNGVIEEDKARG